MGRAADLFRDLEGAVPLASLEAVEDRWVRRVNPLRPGYSNATCPQRNLTYLILRT